MDGETQQLADDVFEEWYASLKNVQRGRAPAKGTIGAALVLMDRLKDKLDLEISSHLSADGVQIAGVSGTKVGEILGRFGEARKYLSEGGRTNRGAPKDLEKLLLVLKSIGIEKYSSARRVQVFENIQQRLANQATEALNKDNLKFAFNPTKTTWTAINTILNQAKTHNKHGPVAEYLVGAKLALRFPDVNVRNTSYSTSDRQRDEPGDFHIGNTAIHVSVAPNEGHYRRFAENLDDGLRVFLVVPDDRLERERKAAASAAPREIAVESIESFVSQNLEELGGFEGTSVFSGLRRLLEIYNERVDAVELDKSHLIAIPENLI